MGGIFPGRVGDRRRLAGTAGAMTVVAGLNVPAVISDFGKFLALLDQCRAGVRQRQVRNMQPGVVRGYIGDVVRCQRLCDRRHDSVITDTRPEVAELLRQIIVRLSGNSGKRAGSVGGTVEVVALGAARRASGRTLRS